MVGVGSSRVGYDRIEYGPNFPNWAQDGLFKLIISARCLSQ